MSYLLYYAGMAQNQITEQIGLAISQDGRKFDRVGNGLIIPIVPSLHWKSLRTCNPTVLQEDGAFLMLYQGISADRQTSIGCAHSTDGITWDCEAAPALTPAALADELQIDRYGTADIIEPAVIRTGAGYRMWFISRGDREPGNRLHHATSKDGVTWQVDRTDMLAGDEFGPRCRIHYPQVVADGNGYWVYISVRQRDGYFSVRRARSPDGYSIGSWEDVTPPGLFGSLLLRLSNRLRLTHWPFSHGLAHSHFVPGESTNCVYYHAYHTDRARRTYMDIVAVDSWKPLSISHVFEPAEQATAWDSFFVADPYVLRTD